MTPSLPLSTLQLRSSAGLYGADRMVLTLARALSDRGVPSRLLSINNYRLPGQLLHEAAHASGQDSVLLPCDGRFDLRTARTLAHQIAAGPGRLQVLHAHDYKSAFYAWLANRHCKVPMVATLHGWIEGSRSQRIYNRVELALLRRFDAIVVVATDQAERLHHAGIASKRIHQVDNAIEPPSPDDDARIAEVRQELQLANVGFVFGAVSRLSAEKNLAQLLEAFQPLAQHMSGAHLLIVGDGPEREALEARCRELSLTFQVTFAGNRSDMGTIYPLLDCLVLPSLTEGMPLVVLEAMTRGIPVVASAVGDVPRLLAHANHARLVPPGDRAALATALDQAIGFHGRRDAAARAYALAHHAPSVMADRYIGIYRKLLVHTHVDAAH